MRVPARDRYFLLGLKTNGKLAFVGLSAVGKLKRWKMRTMQPETRGLESEDPPTLALVTLPPGATLNPMLTLPWSVGSLAAAAS
jgi:hypothetical protein